MLTRYSSLGASSRLRSFQYIPFLQKKGWIVHVAPFFSDSYLSAIYNHKSRWWHILKAYINRFNLLFKMGSFDLVWVEKEIFPFMPALVECFLHYKNRPFIVDYDDAIFHRYDNNKSIIIKSFFSKKIDVVMRNATNVIVGNKYLADRSLFAGAVHVEKIPTVVDLSKYSKSVSNSGDSVNIGWIGTPVTSKYLYDIIPALESIKKMFNVKILAVGFDKSKIHNDSLIELIPWSEETEVQSIQMFDIGIMPLPDDPFERGKCGYKLIQYMACRLPVVASPVGVNKEIVVQGENGFLARTIADWENALTSLIRDKQLRQEMGENGFKCVDNKFSLKIQAPRLESIFRSAIS